MVFVSVKFMLWFKVYDLYGIWIQPRAFYNEEENPGKIFYYRVIRTEITKKSTYGINAKEIKMLSASETVYLQRAK